MNDATLLPFVIGGFALWSFFLLLDVGFKVWMWVNRRRVARDLFGWNMPVPRWTGRGLAVAVMTILAILVVSSPARAALSVGDIKDMVRGTEGQQIAAVTYMTAVIDAVIEYEEEYKGCHMHALNMIEMMTWSESSNHPRLLEVPAGAYMRGLVYIWCMDTVEEDSE